MMIKLSNIQLQKLPKIADPNECWKKDKYKYYFLSMKNNKLGFSDIIVLYWDVKNKKWITENGVKNDK